MKTRLLGFVLAVMVAASAGALNAEDKGVAGKWTMSIEDTTMSMVLAQSRKTIKGTLESPHGPIEVKGEFDKGKISFSGAIDGPPHRLEVSATGSVRADGTLAGDMVTNVGNMSWTAVRDARP